MKTDRNTQFEAFYQYLADHTIPTEKGPCVSFLLKDKKTMKKRIIYRERGFKRVNSEDIIENVMKYREQLPYVKKAKKHIQRLQKNENRSILRGKLEKEGSFKTKLVFKIRKWCDEYINNEIKKRV